MPSPVDFIHSNAVIFVGQVAFGLPKIIDLLAPTSSSLDICFNQ
jgi:hypothetical protein